jgi:molybdopterin molybdotransferase
VAEGENVIRTGEDVAENQLVIPRGFRIRTAEIGGLMALGITRLPLVKRVRVALISSGDEVIEPSQDPQPGQVRDINTYTLSALVTRVGGEPVPYGIVKDNFEALKAVAGKALGECDMVIITAGSSASTRDMTADVISTLGKPGVLVHGINTRPGKPTILGVCDGKAVIGLPGNPVSALVNGYLFVAPLIEKLLGITASLPKPAVRARLAINLPSQAGREDWQPVKLVATAAGWDAEPIFGKSNLIFSLAAADGLIKIIADANGISAGEMVDVILMD